MHIEYTLTRKDYREFLKLTYRRIAHIGKGKIKFIALSIVTWICVVIALEAIFQFYKLYHWIDFFYLELALLFLVIGFVWLIGASIYQRRFYMHYSIDDNGYLLQNHNVDITENAIIVTTGDISSSYSWSAFQGKEHSNDLVCLYIDNGQAVIFPRRAFQGKDQFEEFMALFNSRVNSNH